ncbi:hypothetical protein [Francisella uliginis]|uniref:Uncharacterized protein n=1 Tax=Francisella uliginis TaxID=573570 RepID=A0A1L4BR61_9GAMM|nr:hypothetical protein [Francisella uliginis]API86318.1 hypothetical protein F7310_02665 [Francisella uliginis]
MDFSNFINLVVIVVTIYYVDLAIKTRKIIYLVNAIVVGGLIFLVLTAFNTAYNGIFNPENQQHFERSYYITDANKLYNESTLNSDVFTSLPASQQIISNIPECMFPNINQVKGYLKAYDKIYNYLVSTNSYSNKITVGKVAKAVLDYNYNYHNIGFFRKIYNIKINDSQYKNVADLINPIWAKKYGNKESLYNILNKNFDEQEQLKIAKATLSIYKQASNNCVQSGYGQEFWSVFWGLSSPSMIGGNGNTVLEMQKSLIVVPDFAKSEDINMDYKKIGKLANLMVFDKSVNFDIKSYIIMSFLIESSQINHDLMAMVLDWSYMENLYHDQDSSDTRAQISLKKLNNHYFEVAKYFKQLSDYILIIEKRDITNDQKLNLERLCQKYVNVLNKTNLKNYLQLRNYLIYRLFIVKQACEAAQGVTIDTLYKNDFKKYYK